MQLDAGSSWKVFLQAAGIVSAIMPAWNAWCANDECGKPPVRRVPFRVYGNELMIDA
jgi:hypothetical protein